MVASGVPPLHVVVTGGIPAEAQAGADVPMPDSEVQDMLAVPPVGGVIPALCSPGEAVGTKTLAASKIPSVAKASTVKSLGSISLNTNTRQN